MNQHFSTQTCFCLPYLHFQLCSPHLPSASEVCLKTNSYSYFDGFKMQSKPMAFDCIDCGDLKGSFDTEVKKLIYQSERPVEKRESAYPLHKMPEQSNTIREAVKLFAG